MSVPAPASTALVGGPEPGAQVHRAHTGVITAFVAAGIAFTGLAAGCPTCARCSRLTPSQLGLLLLAVSSGGGALAAVVGLAVRPHRRRPRAAVRSRRC